MNLRIYSGILNTGLQCFSALQDTIIKKIKHPAIEPSMKIIVAFALFMAVGCILATGCVAMTNKNTVNTTTAARIAPFSTLSDPGLNTTINATVNSTSPLNGSLRVSVRGIPYPANLPVVLDNETVGTVNPTTPLYLMVPEGDHTVMVCVRSVCEQENVTTRFGRYVTVDFAERLQRDVEFLDPFVQPTARILECYKNGNSISIDVEFINPSTKDYLMSVKVGCGYHYIDDRTGIKMAESSGGTLMTNVKAGQRITKSLVLYLANGHSLSYDYPVIQELTIK
jgi:hypothetical protein